MHLMLWIVLENAEDQDKRDTLMKELRVDEWRVQRQVEQRTRLVPREPGAPAWWYDDAEAYESSQAAAVQLQRGSR